MKETGRFSNSPVYVVGIYSGADQLGEGFGSSLKMAEFRVGPQLTFVHFFYSFFLILCTQAAEDALHRLYLTRQPSHLIQLPTSTFPEGTGSIFEVQGMGASYSPGEFSDVETLYGSSDRTGMLSPGRRALVDGEDEEI